MQTPNLTCKPVISALLDALGRGVNVIIVTSRNMMLLEQLVTAGTTTSWCIRSFVRRYRAMITRDETAASRSTLVPDLEAGHTRPGQLHISYFHPHRDGKSAAVQRGSGTLVAPEEPVQSHLKLTVVDGVYTVLGSGNMDRASWYTSQELGILFQSKDVAAATMSAVSGALDGRLDTVFQSS
jgi:phosphatidylserine/phosphatidylglycerophosphate/cardiolipin synthase-like enzyme